VPSPAPCRRTHAFLTRKAAQVLGHHRVLALAFAELHERNPVLRYEAFQLCNEVPADRAHLFFIGVEQRRLGLTLNNQRQFPRQIVRILQARIRAC
jgi:hypothetical protein